MTRFGNYVETKGLRANAEKSKVMRFRKGKERWKEMKIFWKGEEIEEVTEFS